MVKFPKEFADKVIAWGKEHIPDDVLYDDEEHSFGRETRIHATTAYGLKPEDSEGDVRANLWYWGKPVKVKLKEVSKFEQKEKGYDVVKIAIESQDLHDLHKQIEDNIGLPGNTFLDYKPHLTLCYVLPDSCDKLLGEIPFPDEFELTEFEYSCPKKEGEKDAYVEYDVARLKKSASLANQVENPNSPLRPCDCCGQVGKWDTHLKQLWPPNTVCSPSCKGEWWKTDPKRVEDFNNVVKETGRCPVDVTYPLKVASLSKQSDSHDIIFDYIYRHPHCSDEDVIGEIEKNLSYLDGMTAKEPVTHTLEALNEMKNAGTLVTDEGWVVANRKQASKDFGSNFNSMMRLFLSDKELWDEAQKSQDSIEFSRFLHKKFPEGIEKVNPDRLFCFVKASLNLLGEDWGFAPTTDVRESDEPTLVDLESMFDLAPWNTLMYGDANIIGKPNTHGKNLTIRDVVERGEDKNAKKHVPTSPATTWPLQDQEHPWGFPSTIELKVNPDNFLDDYENRDLHTHMDSTRSFVRPNKDLSTPGVIPLLQKEIRSSQHRGWIGVDLDGTLAEYHGWKGSHHIGKPIPTMMERVKGWIKEGKKVKIFTARANNPSFVSLVKDWLEENGLPRLDVTNKKDPSMEEIWDDRAVHVEKNTGRVIGSLSSKADQTILDLAKLDEQYKKGKHDLEDSVIRARIHKDELLKERALPYNKLTETQRDFPMSPSIGVYKSDLESIDRRIRNNDESIRRKIKNLEDLERKWKEDRQKIIHSEVEK